MQRLEVPQQAGENALRCGARFRLPAVVGVWVVQVADRHAHRCGVLPQGGVLLLLLLLLLLRLMRVRWQRQPAVRRRRDASVRRAAAAAAIRAWKHSRRC
jgi:hypothetical protein